MGADGWRQKLELTHRFTWGPRLSWKAWGSILTVTLKEKKMTGRPREAPPVGHQEIRFLPSLPYLQCGQPGLGVQGFQEDPRRK